MPEKTYLENQEDEIKGVIFGKPEGLGSVDKSMLEMTPTNRLVFDSRQSELQIACLLLHEALVKTDNRRQKYKRVQDSQTGEWHTERLIVDNWKWLLDFDFKVMSNQLTIKGYSRSQHLRQNAQQEPVTVEDEQQGFWERLFSR